VAGPVRALIELHEPYLKRKIRLGKFDLTPQGVPCYTVDLSGDHDRMEKLDAWGVCPAVLEKMEDLGIDLIIVYDKAQDATFTATRKEVLEQGILRAFPPRGAYYHLPLKRWKRAPGQGLHLPLDQPGDGAEVGRARAARAPVRTGLMAGCRLIPFLAR